MQPGWTPARTHGGIATSLCLALFVAASTATAQATTSTPEGPGRHDWRCAGAFANGRPLAADLSMETILDGRGVLYRHHDRAPGTYAALAVLPGPEADSTGMLTRLWDNGGGQREFRASRAREGVIRLEREVPSGPYQAERFTFQPRDRGGLWFAWEIRRDGRWVLGDSLACRPA